MLLLSETVNYLSRYIKNSVDAVVILGSGLGQFTSVIDVFQTIPYTSVPHFPRTTVEGHQGNLLIAKLGNADIVVLQGRFHYYEGYSLREACMPLRALSKFSPSYLFISNAAGGINPALTAGDIMVIEDHIHFFPDNPLRGKNDDTIGPRFPNMSVPYDEKAILLAEEIACQHSIRLKKGIYMGWQGPSYESIAEYKMIRYMGADAVGMSSTYEVIMANYLGMRCFGVSVITNMLTDHPQHKTTHEEVKDVSARVQSSLNILFSEMIKKWICK